MTFSAATPRTIELRVRWLSFGFFLLFIAYSSAQLLQTAINGPKGYVCLFLVYSFFGVSSLTAPKMVSWFSATVLLPISAIGYVCMVASNIFAIEAFLAPSCAFVGVCAATLWASQSVLIGASSVSLSKVSGDELTLCTSKLNSQFYAIFMTSGIVSGIFSTIVMLSGLPNAVQLLFTLLTFIGTSAVFVLATIPQPEDMTSRAIDFQCSKLRFNSEKQTKFALSDFDDNNMFNDSVSWWTDGRQDKLSIEDVSNLPSFSSSSSSSTAASTTTTTTTSVERPTLLYMLWFITHDVRMRLLIPTMFTNGLIAGFFNGALLGVLFKGHLGAQFISLIGAIYCAIAALASNYLWQRLAKVTTFGRRWSFAVALIGYSLWYALIAIYTAVQPPPEATLSPDFQPSIPSIIFFTFLSISHGILDPVLNTFIPATLQVFFPAGRDLLSSMGSIRVFYSAGFALQQVISISFLSISGKSMISEQCVIVSCVTVISALSLFYLNKYICAIDLTIEIAATATAAASSSTSINKVVDKI
jgi:hypothetical protein